ncbi:thermonuclease family protein [Bosea sp. 117]|uniref:thermonuclease family protein n=1 Tax=Bosea sp. 117 TaxID=1125973 RepID=UPI000A9B8606|nr:thermonuclease family protein [Bosea sp. 117]
MWRRSTIRSVLVALVMIVVALVAERWLPALTGTVHVVDGDSLEVGGERIRLDGIDAPELNQNCGPPEKAWPCGRRARAALEAAVKGREVSCRPLDTDRYGRSVSFCHAGDVDLARHMAEQGMAVALGLTYAGAEANARRARSGIWSGPFERPAEWRALHP